MTIDRAPRPPNHGFALLIVQDGKATLRMAGAREAAIEQARQLSDAGADCVVVGPAAGFFAADAGPKRWCLWERHPRATGWLMSMTAESARDFDWRCRQAQIDGIETRVLPEGERP